MTGWLAALLGILWTSVLRLAERVCGVLTEVAPGCPQLPPDRCSARATAAPQDSTDSAGTRSPNVARGPHAHLLRWQPPPPRLADVSAAHFARRQSRRPSNGAVGHHGSRLRDVHGTDVVGAPPPLLPGLPQPPVLGRSLRRRLRDSGDRWIFLPAHSAYAQLDAQPHSRDAVATAEA